MRTKLCSSGGGRQILATVASGCDLGHADPRTTRRYDLGLIRQSCPAGEVVPKTATSLSSSPRASFATDRTNSHRRLCSRPVRWSEQLCRRCLRHHHAERVRPHREFLAPRRAARRALPGPLPRTAQPLAGLRRPIRLPAPIRERDEHAGDQDGLRVDRQVDRIAPGERAHHRREQRDGCW
jgi:hypothetical protein